MQVEAAFTSEMISERKLAYSFSTFKGQLNRSNGQVLVIIYLIKFKVMHLTHTTNSEVTLHSKYEGSNATEKPPNLVEAQVTQTSVPIPKFHVIRALVYIIQQR